MTLMMREGGAVVSMLGDDVDDEGGWGSSGNAR